MSKAVTKEPYIVFNLWGQKCWLSWTEFCLLSREKKPRGSRRRGGKENEVRACVCVCTCVCVLCACACFPSFCSPLQVRRFGISSYVGHFDHSCYADVAGAVSSQGLQAVSASAAIRLALCYPYQHCGCRIMTHDGCETSDPAPLYPTLTEASLAPVPTEGLSSHPSPPTPDLRVQYTHGFNKAPTPSSCA